MPNQTPIAVSSISTHRRATGSPVPWVKPVFSHILHVTNLRPSRTARHRHGGDFEIVAVEQGVYHTRLNDVPLMLKSDQVLIVKPGDWHEDAFTKGLTFYSIYFRLESDLISPQAALLFRDNVLPLQQKARVPRKDFLSLFRRIQQEAERPDAFSANLQDALSAEFFWLLVRALGKEAVCPEIVGLSEEQRLRADLYRLFQQHVHAALSVRQMAAALKMSESSLAHRCVTLTGFSPAHAFMNFKISQARLLLESTRTPIKEISLQFGFANPYHFSHAFKRFTGHSPSHFKQACLH